MDKFDTFFALLKQSIVGLMLTVFAFMAVYVPNPTNKVETAQALDLVEDIVATISNALQLSEQAQTRITSTINTATNKLSAAYNFITSKATNSLWFKEFTLDGIAWAVAKSIISSMTQSLVKWINSGFKGSPAFVQDLLGTLLEAADIAAGDYISNLGGAEFLCAPFRLDIQIALDIKYRQSRIDQPTSDCRLSDIVGNLKDFISGAQGTFANGGWDNWLTISAAPDRYTPLGGYLSAEAGLQAKLLNATGEKKAVIEFGQGFLSNEVCEMEYGWAEPQEKCYISTPGKTISEALSFNLDSGRQSLIAADEIDEIIGSLLGQIANAAVTGAKGLLGLSEGTGYTYNGYAGGSYVNNLNIESNNLIDFTNLNSNINVAITNQQDLNKAADSYYYQLINSNKVGSEAAANEALTVIKNTNSYIAILKNLDTIINDPNSSQQAKDRAAADFSNLEIYTKSDADALVSNWNNILNSTLLDYSTTINKIQTSLNTQQELKNTIDYYVSELDNLNSDVGDTAASEAREVSTNLKNIINTLSNVIKTLNSFTTNEIKNAAVAKYENLSLYTQQDINNLTEKWQPLLN